MPVGPPVAVPGATTVLLLPLAAADPAALLDAPPPIRALLAFAAVGGLGWLVRRRAGPFLERARDASMERPLLSLGYGAGAHAAILLGVVYLATQLVQLGTLGAEAAIVGVLLAALLALAAAAVGFTVIGSTLATLAREDGDRYGPFVGAAIAGALALLDPLPGSLLWFVVVSMGIGGPARRWVNADVVERP